MRDTIQPSGRFVLRLPPPLHARLRDSAQSEGVSLNEHCIGLLAQGEAGHHPFADVIERAMLEAGESLVGIVLFGSYGRGTARTDSDIDLLIVLDNAVTRSQYGGWDAEPMRYDGRPVEPHLVQLPGNEDRITSLWAEVSIEGIPIYDPAFRIARHLLRVRHAVLNGEMIRRTAQGKPYWAAA